MENRKRAQATKTKNRTAKPAKAGVAETTEAPKAIVPPAPPGIASGFDRVDVHPLVWSERRGSVCAGAFVSVERTARPLPSGETAPCEAAVIVLSEPTHAVHRYDGEQEVPAGTAVRVVAPELQALAGLAMDPEHAVQIRCTKGEDGRLYVDIGPSVARASITPRLRAPEAQSMDTAPETHPTTATPATPQIQGAAAA